MSIPGMVPAKRSGREGSTKGIYRTQKVEEMASLATIFFLFAF
jgi:hypothetical protein